MTVPWWALVAAAASISGVATGALRRYALRRSILDHPNVRSSHSVPVPRGGGIAVLLAFVAVVLSLAAPGPGDWRLWIALIGLVPTAVVGAVDDRRSLPVNVRLLSHLASAAAMIPLALSVFGAETVLVAVLLAVGWSFLTVSSINVVNFMDGIDGIIGLQTVVFSAHLALLAAAPEIGAWPIALLGAAVGFLFWNWSPARIFLGDVGSGSLGALWMLCGLLVMREGRFGLIPVFLPLAPLVLDATATLVRRAIRREQLTQPHRQHLYQRLANGGWGHARVSILYGGLAAVGAGAAQAAGTAAWPLAVAGFVTSVIILALALERSTSTRDGSAPLSPGGRSTSAATTPGRRT